MPLDDIEQDEAPRDDRTRGSLNTTNRTNTKRDNVDKDTADKIGNERQDTDGGHKRDTTSGGAVVSSGNKQVKKDPPPEEKTNDDNAISGFIQKLLSGTFGDTKEDEEEIKTGNNQDEEDRPPSDEELDSGEADDTPPVTTTGSDRSGEFGSGSGGNDGPTFIAEGRNRSKGLHIEYKGVKYTIDRKGTTDDLDAGSQAWQDDTVTVGTTVISLKDYFAKSDEERKKMFSDAVGGSSSDVPATPPTTKKFNVKSIFWVVKRDSKYGAIVEVSFDNNGTKTNVIFDDTGHVEILGVKYSAKEVFIDGDGSYVVEWLKKQVDDTKSEELTALYVGWGFTPDTPPADTPNDENPATNPQDPEQKFEIKEKSNESPEGAPVQVENSKALTEIKKRLLDAKRDGVPASMRIQSFIKPVFGPGDTSIPGGIWAGSTSLGYWAFRSNVNGTANQAGAANEYKRVESSITGAVKFGPGKATWTGITKKAILGVQVHPEKNLKITNYPIIMNAPEVGIPNTAIPYVFENQTEQHRMVTGGIFNESGWGIGAMESYSSWAERSHWCGYHAKFCWNHSGYITPPAITLDNPEGAGNATDVYSKTLPKPVTQDSEGTYASLPMFVNPDTGKMEVDPDLYNMGSPIKGAKDAREHCHLYKFYKQTSYTKKTIQKIPGTKKVNGKIVEVMNEKELKEQIAITVYEQMLPNPISAIFIRGIHFNGQKESGQITEMGKKLMDHFLSQRGWEASIITRGGHVEVCPYLDPDGTMWRLGGNTGSDAISGNAAAGSAKVSGAGWRFCCQPGKIWNFAGDGPGGHIAFHKLINSQSSPEYQKVEPTMNGIFRRTELVDNYMKAVVNRQKGILATLKNTLYDQIIEPG